VIVLVCAVAAIIFSRVHRPYVSEAKKAALWIWVERSGWISGMLALVVAIVFGLTGRSTEVTLTMPTIQVFVVMPTVEGTATPVPTFAAMPEDTVIPTPSEAPRPTSTLTPVPTVTVMYISTPTQLVSLAPGAASATPTVAPGWICVDDFPAPGSGAMGIVRIGDRLWVAVPDDSAIYRLDLDGNLADQLTFPKGYLANCRGLAYDGQHLWVYRDGHLLSLDPSNGNELVTFEVTLTQPVGLTWDGKALVLVDGRANIERYNGAGERLQRLAVAAPHGGVTSIGWVRGELWLRGGDLYRFDGEYRRRFEANNMQACWREEKPFSSVWYSWDGDCLWLSDSGANRIYRCRLKEG
jgi:hypothetical protein